MNSKTMTMPENESQTDVLTIGKRLRNAREDKNLTIEDVHLRLHIHQDTLKRIENDDFEAWPGGLTYAKGFIRQYAVFLGVNSQDLLAEFDSLGLKGVEVRLTVGEKKEIKPAIESKMQIQREPKAAQERVVPSFKLPEVHIDWAKHLERAKRIGSVLYQYRTLILKSLAIGVAAFVTLFLLYSAVNGVAAWVKSWGENKKTESLRPTTAPQPSQPRRAVQSVQPPAAKTPKNNAAPSVPPGPPPDASFINSPQQQNFPTIPSKQSLVLTVDVTTDVWLRVISDGDTVFESILKNGERAKWDASKEMIIKMGRPAGVLMNLNGYEMGKPGDGMAKHVKITHRGMQKL